MTEKHDQSAAGPPANQPTTIPKVATAEEVLALRKMGAPKEPFDVPAIGRVYVHGLTNLESRQWRESCRSDDNGRISDPYADAKLVIQCARDEQGNRLFTERHVTQIVELPEFIVGKLVALCMRLCGIGAEADAEIAKNYAATVTAAG